jgi:D-sedoheptulose 7-phosphate isomerase
MDSYSEKGVNVIWEDMVFELRDILDRVSVSDSRGCELAPNGGFELWKNLTLQKKQTGNTVFLIGNGGSASMASHLAVDLGKHGKIRTEVFANIELITTISNDISYDQVYAVPLRLKMIKDDMLVAISSSGNSPNILRAAETARELNGIIVTVSGMKEDNALRKMGDLNFYVPARTYGMTETAHAALLHYWNDLIIGAMGHER